MTRFAIHRVKATPRALDVIERLREKHGDLAFFADCRDGSVAMCLSKAELLPSPNETKLGEIGASPCYVDAEQYERYDRPVFLIDVAPGAAGGLNLQGLEDIHFVSRITRTRTATQSTADPGADRVLLSR